MVGVMAAWWAPGSQGGIILSHVGFWAALAVSMLVIVQQDMLVQAEIYASQTHRGGFRYKLDLGIDLFSDEILPKVLATGLVGGIAALCARVFMIAGVKIMAGLSLDLPLMMVAGFSTEVLPLLGYAGACGVWLGFSAFLAGCADNAAVPGMAAARALHFGLSGLAGMIFLGGILS
jgi:hypothetical protein